MGIRLSFFSLAASPFVLVSFVSLGLRGWVEHGAHLPELLLAAASLEAASTSTSTLVP